MKKSLIIILSAVMIQACGSDTPGADYQAVIDEAWVMFEAGSYENAATKFTEARDIDSTFAEAYTGIGWSSMKLDLLSGAAANFSAGENKTNTTADLFAGYAFVLNAQKLYSSSNIKAEGALVMNSEWSFAHLSGLNKNDLHITRAENYFALGQFTQSLAAVQQVNVSFTVNVSTPTGQGELADEIERLKLAN